MGPMLATRLARINTALPTVLWQPLQCPRLLVQCEQPLTPLAIATVISCNGFILISISD